MCLVVFNFLFFVKCENDCTFVTLSLENDHKRYIGDAYCSTVQCYNVFVSIACQKPYILHTMLFVVNTLCLHILRFENELNTRIETIPKYERNIFL